MARARFVQFAVAILTPVAFAAWLAFLFFGLFAPVLVFLEPRGHDTTNDAIRYSALRVVLVWCFAWPIALARTAVGHVAADAGRVRALWTLGCLLLWIHIAIAFHAGHGWSHAEAWEHTRQVGGYGAGVFVNYLFALMWFADVVWAWGAFESYLGRPRWLTWAVHGFFFSSFSTPRWCSAGGPRGPCSVCSSSPAARGSPILTAAESTFARPRNSPATKNRVSSVAIRRA